MHIQTHIMSGWCLANCFTLTARERFLAMLAATLPDFDGGTWLLGRDAYWATHHVYGHNLLFALLLSAVLTVFSTAKFKCFLLFLALVHLHFALDLLGSGEGWGIPFWLPFDGREYEWSFGWEFDNWRNKAAALLLLGWCCRIAVRPGRTPFEWPMPNLDRQLVELARRLWKRFRKPEERP